MFDKIEFLVKDRIKQAYLADMDPKFSDNGLEAIFDLVNNIERRFNRGTSPSDIKACYSQSKIGKGYHISTKVLIKKDGITKQQL